MTSLRIENLAHRRKNSAPVSLSLPYLGNLLARREVSFRSREHCEISRNSCQKSLLIAVSYAFSELLLKMRILWAESWLHEYIYKEVAMTATIAHRELTGMDRCDRCGAQAYVRAVLGSSGGELLFCGHHARAVEAKLRPLTIEWQDETQRLHEKPALVDAE